MSQRTTTTTRTTTATHAVVDTVETYIQNQNLLGEVAELDDVLCNLVDMHKDNELALKRVLQCLYRLLHNHNKWHVKFGAKVFHKLIALLIADGGVGSVKQSQQLVANVLICVQLHARKFPRHHGKHLLSQLWLLSLCREKQPHAAQILVQLCDDFLRDMGMEFACSAQLHAFLQQLLQSELREERRAAYFLMRKLLLAITAAQECEELLQRCGWRNIEQFEQHWSAYVTILENLEEQQSHLVLPTLSTLLPRIVAVNRGEDWQSWLSILFVKLLRDNNNILVLRWSLEYMLAKLTAADLIRLQVLPAFLAATNNTQLYNVEGYFLEPVQMQRFLPHSEISKFLSALVTVHWRAMPMLYWLQCLDEQQEPIAKCVLLKLCACVRALQNTKLRAHAIRQVFKLFQHTIDDLTLAEFMVFLETLYNISDVFDDHQILAHKILACKNFELEMLAFSKRCYEIVVQKLDFESEFLGTVLEQLKQVPPMQHGNWTYLYVFHAHRKSQQTRQKHLDFVHGAYCVNVELLQKCGKLDQLQSHLLSQLKCVTKERVAFVREHSVDLFVSANIAKWSDMEQLQLQPLELLDLGSERTFLKLSELLPPHEMVHENLLPALKAMLKKYLKQRKDVYEAVKGLLHYAQGQLNAAQYEQLIMDIISIDPTDYRLVEHVLSLTPVMPASFYIDGMLQGETVTGDERIEAAYLDKFDIYVTKQANLRDVYGQAAERVGSSSNLVDELLCLNNALTVRKPRYFSNSKEHRLKLRIARSVLKLTLGTPYWSEHLWTALLSPNEQRNVSYLYECLVAQQAQSLQFLLERTQTPLCTGTPSQQVSLISVLHIYWLKHWPLLKLEQLQDIFGLLLPHTMGSHFQTRLLAQLVIHRLAAKCEQHSIHLPIAAALKPAIELTFADKLAGYQKELRLLLPYIATVDKSWQADLILHLTNAPYDEYAKTNAALLELAALNDASCQENAKSNTHFAATMQENVNVQRKMNPVNDIYALHDLSTVVEAPSNDNELLVVASLIDKLPNLGGLARTCEVLGVKTLIMDSRAHMDKSDFKNLSMTAEKTLNIMELKPKGLIEFLLEKQSAGYKIVGAEQTAHSIGFADFKFPKKCVLLLGHEKHGIPLELIGLLDYAVEIPQFGMVRSLNVHVTGSLFIWEYCRQHLIDHSD